MNRNGGHRNEKTISVLLAIMMIMLSLLPTMVLAEERDKTYDVTLGEIQQELIDYASIAGSKLYPVQIRTMTML